MGVGLAQDTARAAQRPPPRRLAARQLKPSPPPGRHQRSRQSHAPPFAKSTAWVALESRHSRYGGRAPSPRTCRKSVRATAPSTSAASPPPKETPSAESTNASGDSSKESEGSGQWCVRKGAEGTCARAGSVAQQRRKVNTMRRSLSIFLAFWSRPWRDWGFGNLGLDERLSRESPNPSPPPRWGEGSVVSSADPAPLRGPGRRRRG